MEDTAGARPETLSELLDLLAKLRLHEAAGPAQPRDTVILEKQPFHSSLTLTVAPKGPADFRSVQEAIRSAQPGARIVVRPGRYEEGLILDKNLEICGEGPREEIIIESPDFHCLAIQAGRVSIKGLTLRSLGGRKGNKRFAVDLVQGQAVLEECDISSDTLAGVSVHGPASEATVCRCRIHDGGTSGIIFWDKGRGTVEDCDISANGMAGVLIRSGGNPVIQRNRIRDGKMFGVMVDDHGSGTVIDCDISGNGIAGVQ